MFDWLAKKGRAVEAFAKKIRAKRSNGSAGKGHEQHSDCDGEGSKVASRNRAHSCPAVTGTARPYNSTRAETARASHTDPNSTPTPTGPSATAETRSRTDSETDSKANPETDSETDSLPNGSGNSRINIDIVATGEQPPGICGTQRTGEPREPEETQATDNCTVPPAVRDTGPEPGSGVSDDGVYHGRTELEPPPRTWGQCCSTANQMLFGCMYTQKPLSGLPGPGK